MALYRECARKGAARLCWAATVVVPSTQPRTKMAAQLCTSRTGKCDAAKAAELRATCTIATMMDELPKFQNNREIEPT